MIFLLIILPKYYFPFTTKFITNAEFLRLYCYPYNAVLMPINKSIVRAHIKILFKHTVYIKKRLYKTSAPLYNNFLFVRFSPCKLLVRYCPVN